MTTTLLTPDSCLDFYDTLGCLDYEIYDNPLYQKATIGSFSDYITEHYQEVCLQRLAKMIISGQIPVGKSSKLVPFPKMVQLDCGYIEKIYFYEPPASHLLINRNRVQADIIMKVRLALSDTSRKAVLKQMYRMTAAIDFTHSGLRFTLMDTVSIYKPTRLANVLSEYLVPILDNPKLEAYAADILRIYYPEALDVPCQVSGFLLARRLRLTIEYHKLSENNRIMGQIFFEAGSTMEGTVSANTIVIDRDACKRNNDKSINQVILHECIHHILHRYFFFAQHLYNNDIHYLCYSKDNQFDSGSPLHWVEYHAEQITSRLQMPAATIVKNAKEQYVLTRNYNNHLSPIEKKELVLRDLSELYGVSACAVKNRLISLGCDGLDGVHNFVDGRFIPAYTYPSGSLKKGETFTIGFRHLILLCQQDEAFREKFSDGSFVYAEGHLCRNDKKYLEPDGLSLTKYARSHMHECCLVFSRKYGEVTYNYQEGTLKDEATCVGYYVQYQGQCQAEKEAIAEDPFIAFGRIQNMLDSMPKEFNGTLQYHIDRLGWTNEKLAAESRLSVRTVSRLLENPYPSAKVETIIALCIGMKLDPKISRDLIQKSYISMPPTDLCNAYRIIVEYMYLAGFEACNNALIQHGFKPLPDGDKAA